MYVAIGAMDTKYDYIIYCYFIFLKLNMFKNKLQIFKLLLQEIIFKVMKSKLGIFLIRKLQNLFLFSTICIFRSVYWILELKFKLSNSLNS